MKNILARGGIEFLAVFLGIALSLWVDDYQEEKEIRVRLMDDYKKIHSEIKEDILLIDTLITRTNELLDTELYLMKVLDRKEKFDFDTVVSIITNLVAPTFFGNISAYSSSVTSGRFNMSTEDEITQKVSKLYEHYYKRLVLNGDLIDQRSEAFDREHALEFFKPGYNAANIDTTSIKKYFFGNRFHNGLLLYHDFRKRNYLARLNDTKIILSETDSIFNLFFEKHEKNL
ncbi:MAG: hypothetical protein HOG33_01865 [Candidatus Marinimicrobia bacterium]|jgi:hypothetical protein|nr:hypothetical protein [Candidatus Neomarinimicrobiota bacterium]MBT3796109.1 hypothetical protein [Candidatus Neomarinimicrobiota bacterium]MBT4149520.1 hypothetical protein [Candidatus Neomarinimicrobiota bacterium]MBT5097543.1 hypothetical protein [Candidatus Neomarinimicrobiota bacterium]MBT7525613.1 hypothetical protein [Candidatus Neomarinimicrobiota bacterium]